MATSTPETILIVEDDEGVAELQRRRLERAGYQTVTTAGTDEAMAIMTRGGIGLILLDYHLPGNLNGLDFYGRLQAAGHCPPVIIVTGFSDEPTVIRALRAGVRDFVTKSLEYLDYLPDAVRRVLEMDRIEKRLAQSEAELASIVQSVRDAIITVNCDGRVELFNAAAESMFQVPASEASGQPLSRFLTCAAGEDASAEAGQPGDALPLASRWEWGVRADGVSFPIEASVSRFEAVGRFHCCIVVRDVTERRRAERVQTAISRVNAALAKAGSVEEAQEWILAALGEELRWDAAIVWQVDRDDRVLRGARVWRGAETTLEAFRVAENEAMQEGEGLAGLAWKAKQTVWMPEIHDKSAAQELAERHGFHAGVAFPIAFEDETFCVIELLRRSEKEADERLTRVFAVLGSQIGQFLARKRAEARVREQATLVDQARDAILVLDLEDRVLFWSQGAERVYGWTAAEVIGRSTSELIEQAEIPQAEQARDLLLRTGEWSGELRQRTKQGQHIMVESRWTLLRSDDGQPTSKLVINSDITEKKSLENQLLHAQRMEAVGALAGGVAHEFNNLLQAIHGYTSLSMDGLSPADQRFQDLQQVLKAAERAAGLTRQLLGFGRRQSLDPAYLDPGDLVRDLVKMLRPLIGEHIELTTTVEKRLSRLYGDATLLQQMLMNLCVNARDAMPSGGKLQIQIAEVAIDGEYCDAHVDVAPGGYVLFTVADTGCGMTPEVKERIFEPFFTTKEVGQGTGLGLAMVYGVVQQHGGAIHVYSEPGLGTTFRIYLPAASSPEEEPEKDDVAHVAGGTETILVAEDEPLVRALAVRILESAGYRTVTATDGEHAVRVFEAHSDEIDLALLDVVMPKLSGRMVCHAIREVNPAVKVLFCSGYDPEISCDGFVVREGAGFVQKPFERQLLLRIVRSTLDEESACLAVH